MREVVGSIPTATTNSNTIKNPPLVALADDFGGFRGVRSLRVYLFNVLQSQAFRWHLDGYAHGTANQASLNVVDVLSFVVPTTA